VQAARFAHWLSALLISDPRQRAAADVLARGRGGPPTLWTAGISGDRPIVLLRLDNPVELSRVQDLLLAQNDWRSKRMAVDVVLLNTAIGAAGDALHNALAPLVSAQQSLLKADTAAVKAELFALRDHAISDDLRNGLLTQARVVLAANERSRTGHDAAPTPGPAGVAIRASTPAQAASASCGPLEFANGSGGFSHAGRAYHIHLDDERCTPAPWINVIANPAFGFLVSAEGGGGRTIRSAICRMRRCICAMKTAVLCGAPPRCRCASPARTTTSRMARALAASQTMPMASSWS
jgi:cellobiose phosphorylase